MAPTNHLVRNSLLILWSASTVGHTATLQCTRLVTATQEKYITLDTYTKATEASTYIEGFSDGVTVPPGQYKITAGTQGAPVMVSSQQGVSHCPGNRWINNIGYQWANKESPCWNNNGAIPKPLRHMITIETPLPGYYKLVYQISSRDGTFWYTVPLNTSNEVSATWELPDVITLPDTVAGTESPWVEFPSPTGATGTVHRLGGSQSMFNYALVTVSGDSIIIKPDTKPLIRFVPPPGTNPGPHNETTTVTLACP